MPTTTTIIDALEFSFLNGLSPLHTASGPAYAFTYQYAGTSAPADLPTSSTYTGWTAFAAAEKAAFVAALRHIETFINVTFTEITGAADPDINVGKVTLPGSTAGYGGYSASSLNGSLNTYDSYVVYDNTIDLSSGETNLILHEMGHALGLKHPFSTPALPAGFDSNKYTVMSYTANPDNAQRSDAMMLYDILALQDLWGANMSTNSGATTYTGSRTTTVDAIWDAGGIDLFSAATHSTATRLDLRQAHFSSFDATDDVVIAYGTDIENATGGAGNDTIIGNGLSNVLLGGGGGDIIRGGGHGDTVKGQDGRDRVFGQNGGDRLFGNNGNDVLKGGKGGDAIHGGKGRDVLFGQAGNDRLWGDGGADRFVFRAGDAHDKVMDFADNIDSLKLVGLGSVSHALSLATETPSGDVVFDFGAGDVLTILHMTIATLSNDILV